MKCKEYNVRDAWNNNMHKAKYMENMQSINIPLVIGS